MSGVDVRYTSRFPQVDRRILDAAADGLEEFAGAVLDLSNERVPRDEGDLERSGDVDVDRDDLTAEVGYGGEWPLSIKAIRQHEDLSLEHDGGRRAKFLESAGDELADEFGDTVARHVKRAT